jgi:hypothetical protein
VTVAEQQLVLDYLMLSIALRAVTQHLQDSKPFDLDSLSAIKRNKTMIRIELITAPISVDN